MVLLRDSKILEKTSLFAQLSNEQIKLVAFGAKRRKLVKGETVYTKGEPSQGAHVLIKGVLKSDFGDDNKIESAIIDAPFTLFGELSLIMEREHSSTLSALEPSQILFVPRPIFLKLIEEYPEVAYKMRSRIERDLHSHVRDLMRVKSKID